MGRRERGERREGGELWVVKGGREGKVEGLQRLRGRDEGARMEMNKGMASEWVGEERSRTVARTQARKQDKHRWQNGMDSSRDKNCMEVQGGMG